MDASFQLYSARDYTSWKDTFELLGKLGYTRVEGFGANYEDTGKTKAMLEANGLTMPSAHFFPIANFEDDFDKTVATARTLGIRQLYCPAPEVDLRNGGDAAAWTALAQRMEDAAKRVQDAGLLFGWHNHHWEFMPLANGDIPMTLILENAPSIEWEIDVAWVVRGGADPLVWIVNHKDRITAAHVKDIAPEGTCEDEDGWADLGHGTLDWKSYMDALRGVGVDIFVMEHDKPSDVARFAERSIATFKTL